MPTFKLFLSVDLVGSTPLKQGSYPYENRSEYFSKNVWFFPLSTFFSMFHTVFYREFEEVLDAEKLASEAYEYASPSNSMEAGRVTTWRLTGDEIVYCLDVHVAEEIYPVVVAFKNALKIVRRLLNSDKAFFESQTSNRFSSYVSLLSDDAFHGSELDVKGCIWSAGFPVTNRMVVIPERYDKSQEALQSTDPEYAQLFTLNQYLSGSVTQQQRYIVDYVGPSMDTGFRLASIATPRKLLLSIEVAYLLSKVNQTWIDRIYRRIKLGSEFSICFDGKSPLKGVMGNKPYPVFYVDCGGDEAINDLEDKIQDISPALNLRDVCDYCEYFFSKFDRFFKRPTILDPESKYRPDNRICADVAAINKIWSEEKARIIGRLHIYD